MEVVRLRRLNIYAVVLTTFKLGFNPKTEIMMGVKTPIVIVAFYPELKHGVIHIRLTFYVFYIFASTSPRKIGATKGRRTIEINVKFINEIECKNKRGIDRSNYRMEAEQKSVTNDH